MKKGLSDTAWASAVQSSRVGIGGVVFLVAARTLPLAEIGAFAAAAAPLRLLQVIHKGGVEDAAVTTPPEDAPAFAALHRLSLLAGAAATLLTLALAPLLDRLTPGANVGLLATALAATSLAHGLAAVPDGILRRAGDSAPSLFAPSLANPPPPPSGLLPWRLAQASGPLCCSPFPRP